MNKSELIRELHLGRKITENGVSIQLSKDKAEIHILNTPEGNIACPVSQIKRALRDFEKWSSKEAQAEEERPGWHKHINPQSGRAGGWVQDTAAVSEAAYVGMHAEVADNARVEGSVDISDHARVFGNAVLTGNELTHIQGRAKIYGNAYVKGNVRIAGDAEVYENARLLGPSSGLIVISGTAKVRGDCELTEATLIKSGVWDRSPEKAPEKNPEPLTITWDEGSNAWTMQYASGKTENFSQAQWQDAVKYLMREKKLTESRATSVLVKAKEKGTHRISSKEAQEDSYTFLIDHDTRVPGRSEGYIGVGVYAEDPSGVVHNDKVKGTVEDLIQFLNKLQNVKSVYLWIDPGVNVQDIEPKLKQKYKISGHATMRSRQKQAQEGLSIYWDEGSRSWDMEWDNGVMDGYPESQEQDAIRYLVQEEGWSEADVQEALLRAKQDGMYRMGKEAKLEVKKKPRKYNGPTQRSKMKLTEIVFDTYGMVSDAAVRQFLDEFGDKLLPEEKGTLARDVY